MKRTLLKSPLWLRLALGFILLPALCGCDPMARQQAMTVFFNRVPTYPDPVQVCEEYDRNRAAVLASAGSKKEVPKQSVHLPYGEKRCNDCHSEEKDMGGGLKLPRNKLCFKCHPDILPHAFAHGPAAEGDCLACHLPHTSSFGFLLIEDRFKLCGGCHTEQRVAAAMHDRLGSKGMACIDCHDPHSGAGKYFLK